MRYLALIIMALFISACSTLRVTNDYDDRYDFSSIKTFAVVHKIKRGENTLIADRIKSALIKALMAKNLKEANPSKADVLFLYHLNVTNKTDIYTDYQMVGFGRFGGTMVATPRSYNYDEGKLIIDAFEPKTKKIIYRSVAIDELKDKKTPKEREKYINEVVFEALKTFPPNLKEK
jgi:hypothetical protein